MGFREAKLAHIRSAPHEKAAVLVQGRGVVASTFDVGDARALKGEVSCENKVWL